MNDAFWNKQSLLCFIYKQLVYSAFHLHNTLLFKHLSILILSAISKLLQTKKRPRQIMRTLFFIGFSGLNILHRYSFLLLFAWFNLFSSSLFLLIISIVNSSWNKPITMPSSSCKSSFTYETSTSSELFILLFEASFI